MSTVVPGGVLIVAYALWYMATTRGVRPAGRGNWPDGAGAKALLILRGLILPLALVALVLGSIIMGWATPSQSGAVGALGAFLLAALTGRFTWTFFIEATSAAARLSAMVFLIIMAAIFMLIKMINTAKAQFEKEKEEAAAAEPPRNEVLLEEIRDLLKKS